MGFLFIVGLIALFGALAFLGIGISCMKSESSGVKTVGTILVIISIPVIILIFMMISSVGDALF